MPTSIEVRHQEVTAELGRLSSAVSNAAQGLAPIGEDIVERIKQRFASATGPDGARWQSNSRVTIMNYIRNRGGFSKKSGKLLAKGQILAAGKRPLQGQTGDLARQWFSEVADDSLTIGSTMRYAAMQQFGGTKAQFRHLWGNIPARQMLPITAAGELYPAEVDLIVNQLRQYLMGES